MIQTGREQDDKRDTVYARLSPALRRRLAERSSRSNTIITSSATLPHRASTVRYLRDMQAQDPDNHHRTRKLVGEAALREARQPHHEQRRCIPLRHISAPPSWTSTTSMSAHKPCRETWRPSVPPPLGSARSSLCCCKATSKCALRRHVTLICLLRRRSCSATKLTVTNAGLFVEQDHLRIRQCVPVRSRHPWFTLLAIVSLSRYTRAVVHAAATVKVQINCRALLLVEAPCRINAKKRMNGDGVTTSCPWRSVGLRYFSFTSKIK
jgi:hypothetical protein